MKPPVSVILVRDVVEQISGGGCCGLTPDDRPTVKGRNSSRPANRNRQDLGALYRALRELFPAVGGRERVAVVIVDPSNQFYLIPKLLRDVFRYRPGWRCGLRTVLQLFSLPAVVVNGRVLSRRDRPLDPDAFCHAVSELLSQEKGARTLFLSRVYG